MCISQVTQITMKDEISAAVLFLTRLIRKSEKLKEEQVETFRTCLYALLTERFKDHWFPQNPCRGQAYRCIRVNETERRDPILEEAARKCGLNYEDLKLPVEMTIWVDPLEVCCRFGEHKGSYCTVASFKNGNKENYVDKINVEELEQKTAVIIRKASYDVQKKRKNAKNSSSPRKNGYSKSPVTQQSILQQLPNIAPAQNFRAAIFPMVQSSSYQRISPPAQNFGFANTNPSVQAYRSSSFFQKVGPQFNNLNQAHLKLGRTFPSHLPLAAGGTLPSSMRFTVAGKNDKYHWNKKALSKV